MNDLRDFVAFSRFGNLGVLVLGIGLLGILIHTKPVRLAVDAAISLLGVLLLWEGTSLLHTGTLTFRTLIALVLSIVTLCLTLRRQGLEKSTGGNGLH